jgi:hypothetical protein
MIVRHLLHAASVLRLHYVPAGNSHINSRLQAVPSIALGLSNPSGKQVSKLPGGQQMAQL